jgi:acyl dehydratase
MEKKHFEDCSVGDRAESPCRTITETDIVLFAGFSGDWNPIHTDAEFAKTSEFGGRIAHGMLTLVVGAGLITRLPPGAFLPRSLIAIVGLERVRMVSPVKIGDTIHVEGEIVEMTKMPDNKGLLEIRFRILNQHGEGVLTGRLKCIAGSRPDEKKGR